MPSSTLCVFNLPGFATEEGVYRIFERFGQVCSVKLWRTDDTVSAMVVFASAENAQEAKSGLDGQSWLGRQMRVDWTEQSPPEAPKKGFINSIYVRFSTVKFEPVTFETLHPVFAQFGTVTEISVKDSTLDPRNGRQSGLAFVHYESTPEGLQCALRAVSAMDGALVDEICYKAEPSRNLSKQFQKLQAQTGQAQSGQTHGRTTTAGQHQSFPHSAFHQQRQMMNHQQMSNHYHHQLPSSQYQGAPYQNLATSRTAHPAHQRYGSAAPQYMAAAPVDYGYFSPATAQLSAFGQAQCAPQFVPPSNWSFGLEHKHAHALPPRPEMPQAETSMRSWGLSACGRPDQLLSSLYDRGACTSPPTRCSPNSLCTSPKSDCGSAFNRERESSADGVSETSGGELRAGSIGSLSSLPSYFQPTPSWFGAGCACPADDTTADHAYARRAASMGAVEDAWSVLGGPRSVSADASHLMSALL